MKSREGTVVDADDIIESMVENAAQVKNVRANLRQNAKKNG